MKSSALRAETKWAETKRAETTWSVTTPEDRAKIQQKISRAILAMKRRPEQPAQLFTEKQGGFRRLLGTTGWGWSERAGNLGQQVSERAQDLSRTFKEQVRPRPEAEIWKGLAAGLAAGVVGTIAMTSYMGVWAKTRETIQKQSASEAEEARQKQASEEPSTEKIAAAISERVFHHRLEGDEKKAAGNAVHYAYGTILGGIYGMLSELYPKLSTGQGTLYGTAVWIGTDELALPAMGISAPPRKRSPEEHAYEASAHAVYGVVTETVRGALRNWLD